jgi:hypothetical protein
MGAYAGCEMSRLPHLWAVVVVAEHQVQGTALRQTDMHPEDISWVNGVIWIWSSGYDRRSIMVEIGFQIKSLALTCFGHY